MVSKIDSFVQSTSPTIMKLQYSSNDIVDQGECPGKTQAKYLKNSKVHNKLLKNQYKLQLNNDHHLLKSILVAEQEESSLKDETSLNKSFKRISAALSIARKDSKYELDNIFQLKSNIIPRENYRIKEKRVSLDSAMIKWNTEENARLISKKNPQNSIKTSKDFCDFLKELFEVLDEDQSGKLTPDEFIVPLLSYGIATNPLYIEKSLMLLLNTKSLTAVNIEKETFINIFKEDFKTDFMLESLQAHTLSFIDTLQETIKNRKKTFDRMGRRDTVVQEIVPRKYCTVEEYIKMIKKWWEDLKGLNRAKSTKDKIHESTLAEFLSKKKLVSNSIEASKISNMCNASGYINYEQFESVFLKAILKSGLINLATGVNDKAFAGKNSSLAMRLSKCQRKFMIAGFSLKNNQLTMQGKKALQAVSKYLDQHKITSRAKITELARKELEQADQIDSSRLKGYLYRINEHANDFVDDLGNINTYIKNTWEIRNHVNRTGKNISNSLDPLDTFNKDLYLKILKQNFDIQSPEHIPDKVKIFRQNYLLEKFSSSIKKTETHRKSNNFSI
jgi:hypothetical protein